MEGDWRVLERPWRGAVNKVHGASMAAAWRQIVCKGGGGVLFSFRKVLNVKV